MAEETIQTGVEQVVPPTAAEGEGQVQEPTGAEEQGRLEALKAEREQRQRAEREAEQLRFQAEQATKMAQFYQGLAMQGQPKAQPEYDPEAIPSYKDVAQMTAQQKAEFQAEMQAELQKMRMRENVRMEREFKKEHPDYDDVSAAAMDMIKSSKNAEAIAKIIAFDSENPAEALYMLGQMSPSFQQKAKSKATQAAAEKITRNLSAPKTLSDAGGGSQPTTNVDWVKMAEEGRFEEMDKKAKEILGY